MKDSKKKALSGIQAAAKKAMLGDKYEGEDKPGITIILGLGPPPEDPEKEDKEKEDED